MGNDKAEQAKQKTAVAMASLATFTAFPAFYCDRTRPLRSLILSPLVTPSVASNARARGLRKTQISAALGQKNALQYRKLGDSDLNISEITIGTVSVFEFLFLYRFSCSYQIQADKCLKLRLKMTRVDLY